MIGNVAHTAAAKFLICPTQDWSCQNIVCNREILLVAVASVRVLTRMETDLERGEHR